MQYFIADKSHSDYLLRELNKDDFDSLKNYHLDFLKFSNVYGCYKNFKVSEQKLKDFLENQKFESSLDTLFYEMRYLFSANILFGRIFVDNVKSFVEQLKFNDLKKEIKIYEKRDELRMMKLLRDYSQHFSSPFDDLEQVVSFTENTCRLEIYTSKKELSRNKYNNHRSDVYLDSLKDSIIPLTGYFHKWCIVLDEIIEKCKQYFLKFTTLQVKIIISQNFSAINYIVNGKLERFYPSYVKKVKNGSVRTPSGHILHNNINENYRFDRDTLEYLFENLSE